MTQSVPATSSGASIALYGLPAPGGSIQRSGEERGLTPSRTPPDINMPIPSPRSGWRGDRSIASLLIPPIGTATYAKVASDGSQATRGNADPDDGFQTLFQTGQNYAGEAGPRISF